MSSEVKKFYMIYNPKDGTPRVKHYNYEEAKAEAERLAKKENTEIYVLFVAGVCRRVPLVEWCYPEGPA